MVLADHPVHPPSSFLKSRFDSVKPPPANYTIKAVNGVFHVYETAEAVERGENLNYTYPVFKKYLDDLRTLNLMISNGPL